MVKADYITLFILLIAAKLILKGVKGFLKRKEKKI